jgi:hypothetical protein
MYLLITPNVRLRLDPDTLLLLQPEDTYDIIDSINFAQQINVCFRISFTDIFGVDQQISTFSTSNYLVSHHPVFLDFIDRNIFLNRSLSDNLSFSDSIINTKAYYFAITDQISFIDSYNANTVCNFSFQNSISFSDSYSLKTNYDRNIQHPLLITQLVDYSMNGQLTYAIEHLLDLQDEVSYEFTTLTKAVSISGFLIPLSDIMILPRFQPITLPFSTYFIKDDSLLGTTFLNLTLMRFTTELSLNTRRLLRRFLIAHDPQPYIVLIEDDLWRGYLVNNQAREKYFTDGKVEFLFELEYIGKWQH